MSSKGRYVLCREEKRYDSEAQAAAQQSPNQFTCHAIPQLFVKLSYKLRGLQAGCALPIYRLVAA